MLIVNEKLVKLITFNFASAITLWPVIILRNQDDLNNLILLNHEKIHLRQQVEFLLLFFYLIYLIEYLIGRLKGKSHYQAYRHISFEKEAFDKENDLSYLTKRRYFSSVRYLS